MKLNSMKIAVGVLFLAGVIAGFCATGADSPMAVVCVVVKDDTGKPVSDAEVGVLFESFKTDRDVRVSGLTDEHGVFSARHPSGSGMILVDAGKENHYSFHEEMFIGPTKTDRDALDEIAKTRQWTKNPVQVDAMLKRVLNPKRIAFHCEIPKRFPVASGRFSLDLESFEWCPPHGNGRHEDVFLELLDEKHPETESRLCRLAISMPNAADGFYMSRMDSRCAFPYNYNADMNAAYMKEGVLLLDRRNGAIVQRRIPAADEYFMFRVRTVTNAEGRVISARYGRVGEGLYHVFGLKAAVWLNQEENDTNLEDGWH